jgi:chemotaxis protein CheC
MLNLTELQRDAMMELLNIGMGRAASALSEMVGAEIYLCVPFLDLLSRHEAIKRLSGKRSERIIAVQQQFSGLLGGDIMLVFPEEKSLELVHVLVKDSVPLEVMTEMEQEVFMEIGNMILNSCIGSISTILKSEMSSSLPILLNGTDKDIFGENFDSHDDDGTVLFLSMGFSLQERSIDGNVAFIINEDATYALQESIDRFISNL